MGPLASLFRPMVLDLAAHQSHLLYSYSLPYAQPAISESLGWERVRVGGGGGARISQSSPSDSVQPVWSCPRVLNLEPLSWDIRLERSPANLLAKQHLTYQFGQPPIFL